MEKIQKKSDSFDLEFLSQKIEEIKKLFPYYELLKQRLQRLQKILKNQEGLTQVFRQVQAFKLTLFHKASTHPEKQKSSMIGFQQKQQIKKNQQHLQQQQNAKNIEKSSQQAVLKNKKSQQTNQNVNQKPSSFPNIFSYSYIFPTTIEEYEKITRSIELQKKFDQNLDKYEIIKQFQSKDLQLVHLTYKRVLLIAPRQFVYMRWFVRREKKLFILTMSVPYQLQSTKMRADIILTITQIQQVQKQIIVKVFSQVDMKAVVKADVAKNKGSFQIKKFLQKMYKYLSFKKN